MAIDQSHLDTARIDAVREEHGRQTINGVCCAGPIILSIMALTLVAQGLLQYGLNPPIDEGMHAFLFQLLMVVQIPMIAIFAATANWTRRSGPLSVLGMQLVVWLIAFGAVLAWEMAAAGAV